MTIDLQLLRITAGQKVDWITARTLTWLVVISRAVIYWLTQRTSIHLWMAVVPFLPLVTGQNPLVLQVSLMPRNLSNTANHLLRSAIAFDQTVKKKESI